MNINEIKTVLKTMVKAKTPITPFIWGQHGIGKSQSIYQVGQELGYEVITITLSQKEPVDLTGMLYTFENKELGMSVTSAHPPDWFARALFKGKCILFFDEFNMARPEAMNASFELVLNKVLNNKKLPDDVFIVAAGNPSDERYDVTPLSESLRDRFMHIHAKADVNSWLTWARTKNSGIHADVIKYIEVNPKAAFAKDAKDDVYPVEIKHALRSWERAGLVHALNLPSALKVECIRGIVGLEHATAFMQKYGMNNIPLDALEVLEFNKATADRVEEMLNPKKMRIDLLTQSIDNLVQFVNMNSSLGFKKLGNVITFIKMLPDDCANRAIAQLFEQPGYAEEFLKDNDLAVKINEIAAATELSKKVG